MFNRGQGTIEYLVIIAVVVVLALVVVGMLITQVDNSSNVTSTASEISNKIGVGGLSLGSSVMGLDTNGLLVIKNIDVENLTLSKIIVDGVDHNFSTQIIANDEKSFKLQEIASCTGGKKNYLVKVEYVSASGLTKVSDFGNLSLDCASVVTSVGVAVEEIIDNVAPSVLLSSPADSYSDTGTRVSFVFTPSDSDGSIASCGLNLTDLMDANSSSSIVEDGENTLEYTLSVGSYDWNISCIDDDGDTNTSETRTLTIEQGVLVEGDYLIAHYLMNDALGTTNVVTNIGSYNGTAQQNTSVLTTSGKILTALSFNGSSDRINLGNNFGFYASDSFSISGWIKITGATHGSLICKASMWGTGYEIKYNPSDNKMHFYLSGSGVAVMGLASVATVNDGDWHYVVATYDGSSTRAGMHLYIDNATESVTTEHGATTTGTMQNAYSTYIGYDQGDNAYLTGSIDDVRIYGKVLTQGERSAIYNGGDGIEAE